MPEPQPPAAILWDLDGVLVDSREAHLEAWRALCAETDRPFDRAYFERTFGLRNEDIVSGYWTDVGPEGRLRLERRKEELFRERAAGRIRALPGAVDLVREAARRGLRQAIVSSTPPENIALALRAIGLEGAFDAIVSGDDVARGKPDPEGYLLAARRLGVDPRRCVVVEDAPAGVEAGRRAGARTLGLAREREPSALGADVVARDLRDASVRRALFGE
ncbi:MAG TPA: HAD family phosphatase [Dehalococcoidia bacterium]|nr:HAD family phosphatase [Dehalococcoidia bacterium]